MAENTSSLAVRYLGGPTALVEIGGVRLLTDPTFDPPGDYPIGKRVLVKTDGPVVTPAQVGRVDAVLLSHDQHPDNLDNLGREYLRAAPLVLSTPAASARLGAGVQALETGTGTDVSGASEGAVRVTSVPARHGPPGCEPVVGDVTGFVVTGAGLPRVYVSGDNASLDAVRTVADGFGPIDVALLFVGAARTALLDGAYLTLTSKEATTAAKLLGARHVVPLHFEGWAHFTQGRASLTEAFAAAALSKHLHLLSPGECVVLD